MNRLYIFTLLISFSIPAWAQESLSLQPGYSQEVFVSLANGEVKSSSLAAWDLAFEIEGFAASIRTNDANGVELFVVPALGVADWALVDTAGIATWESRVNSDDSWSEGALNIGLEEGNDFDLGWGVYNPITHHVVGDSLFVLKLPGNSWKKLRIDQLASGVYGFTIADLDGNNEITRSVDKADFSGKNFGYFSITGDSIADQEPLTADWDLVFHKYVAELAPGVNYGVTGVQSNKGVEVAVMAGIDVNEVSLDDTVSASFTDNLSGIGYDWKSFDVNAFSWNLADSTSYFVKSLDGQIYQIVFTGFDGSTTGNINFETSNLTNSISDLSGNLTSFAVAPNPASDRFSVLVDLISPETVTLTLSNLNGQTLGQKQLTIGGFTAVEWKASQLPAGIYLLKAEAGQQSMVQKIVIQ